MKADHRLCGGSRKDRDFTIAGGFVVRDFRTIIQVQQRTYFPALSVQLPSGSVAISTVRSQIRSVLEKTGSSRQSDLAGLLARIGATAPN